MVNYYDKSGNSFYGGFEGDYSSDAVLEKAWFKERSDRYVQNFAYDGSGVLPTWQVFKEIDFGSSDDLLDLRFEHFGPDSIRAYGRSGNDNLRVTISDDFATTDSASAYAVPDVAHLSQIYLNGGLGHDTYDVTQTAHKIEWQPGLPRNEAKLEIVDYYGANDVNASFGERIAADGSEVDWPSPGGYLYDDLDVSIVTGAGKDDIDLNLYGKSLDLNIRAGQGENSIAVRLSTVDYDIDIAGGNSADEVKVVFSRFLDPLDTDRTLNIETFAGHDEISLFSVSGIEMGSWGDMTIKSGWGDDQVILSLTQFDPSPDDSIEVLASAGDDYVRISAATSGDAFVFVSGGGGDDLISMDRISGEFRGDRGQDHFDMLQFGFLSEFPQAHYDVLVDFDPDEGDTMTVIDDVVLTSVEDVYAMEDRGWRVSESGDDLIARLGTFRSVELTFEDILI